jgi:hypothetical protein
MRPCPPRSTHHDAASCGREGAPGLRLYAGFERLTVPGDIVLAACWAHARRKFYDLHEATGSPIAAEALRRIAELYAIEGSIRGRTADERRHVRNTRARPLIDMMKPWLEMELGRVPPAGPLAEAIRYALARWPVVARMLYARLSDLRGAESFFPKLATTRHSARWARSAPTADADFRELGH